MGLTLDGPRLAPLQPPARQLVVFMHGYGADGNDLIGIGAAWAASLPQAAFAAPHAPEGMPWGGPGRQWFSLPGGFDGTPDALVRALRDGVAAAKGSLDGFVDGELARYGLDNGALALVGFSQGASLALYVGLRLGARAVIAYSGALGIVPSPIPSPASAVMLRHGAEDNVVPPAALHAGAKALRDVGIAVRSAMVPRLGHGIDPDGIVEGARFLAEAFASHATGGRRPPGLAKG
ncbi:MAG: hypothetical protein FJX64_06865 [Alphaproteobacteria bacterium]|nr:hypothetical protein [Alphaproteobacteria bacterium]